MEAYRNGLSPKNGFLKKGNKAMFLYREYPSQISMSFVYSTYLLNWDGFIAANFDCRCPVANTSLRSGAALPFFGKDSLRKCFFR